MTICRCLRCSNLSSNFHSSRPHRWEGFFHRPDTKCIGLCSEVGQCRPTSRDPEWCTCWEQTCTSDRVRYCSAHPSASSQQTAQKPDQEAVAELPDNPQGPGIDAGGVARHHEPQVTDRSEDSFVYGSTKHQNLGWTHDSCDMDAHWRRCPWRTGLAKLFKGKRPNCL